MLYKEFVKKHATNNQYDPEKALSSFLSCLTPDPKAITLLAMDEGQLYFTKNEIYNDILNLIERIGLDREFPVIDSSVWEYCELHKAGEIFEGSLVDTGAVLRHNISSKGIEDYAYQISDAGFYLAKPLVLKATEFVYRAKESKTPHKFDSMGRIFGSIHSKTKKRRPLAVFKFIEFLIKNPKKHRVADIIEAFEEERYRKIVSRIANSLGYAGIIDFESPDRDIKGKRAKGWARYFLKKEIEESNEEIYKRAKKISPWF